MSREKSIDIEEYLDSEKDSYRKKCWCCGQPHVRLTKVIQVETPYGNVINKKTKNHIGMCVNKNCQRYESKVPNTWVTDDQKIEHVQALGRAGWEPQTA